MLLFRANRGGDVGLQAAYRTPKTSKPPKEAT